MEALLVDGLNLVRRIYAGVPKSDTHDGARHTARVVTTSVSSLQRALQFHQPSHALVVFDSSEPTWRHTLYPAYRENRSPMPESLRTTLSQVKAGFLEAGVRSLERPGVETVDIIATIARKIKIRGGRCTILSSDRQMCQLLDESTRIYDHFKQQRLDRNLIQDRFGIEPGKLPFFLALTGDHGKSIPGIAGIGPRTASALVTRYDDLESLLSAAERMTGKIGGRIFRGAESAKTALKLFRFRTDIELGVNLRELRYVPRD